MCTSLGVLIIPNIVFAILLTIVFYRIYFDRNLENHSYLAWYGTWFSFALMELIVFEYVHYKGQHIEGIVSIPYYIIKLISVIILFKAARSFEGLEVTNNHLVIAILGFLLHLAGGLQNVHWIVAVGSIPTLAVFVYNFFVFNKKEYRAFRLPLILGWVGWGILEFKTFIHGNCVIHTVLANSMFLITGLTVLGIHLFRLQRERDKYKIKAYELSEQMNRINLLEEKLLTYADLIGEYDE